MVRFGQPEVDPIRLADHVEAHRPRVDGIPAPGLLCELNAAIREDGVDLVGYGFERVVPELPGRISVRLCNAVSDGELGGAVDVDEEKELALGRLHFHDVDVEIPNGVALEPLPLGFVSLEIRKTRDAMPLQAAIQR
jgi:hypothetical protein